MASLSQQGPELKENQYSNLSMSSKPFPDTSKHPPPGRASSPSFYTVNALYNTPQCIELSSVQRTITVSMRAMLLDWMTEVCAEFTLKRETYHLSVNCLDRLLMLWHNIQKEEFQLIGLGAMYVAAKLEEVYSPKLQDWVRSADNGFSVTQIKSVEQRILHLLCWKALVLTPSSHLNWLMTQWDSFVEYQFGCVPYNDPHDFSHLPTALKTHHTKQYEKRMIYFKKRSNKSYKKYRETMQVLDTASLL